MKYEAVDVAYLRGTKVPIFFVLWSRPACGPEHVPRNFLNSNLGSTPENTTIFIASAATDKVLLHVLHDLSDHATQRSCNGGGVKAV